MSDYTSKRQRKLNIGISSYTEGQLVLDVIGDTNISGITTTGTIVADVANIESGTISYLDAGNANINGVASVGSIVADTANIAGVATVGSIDTNNINVSGVTNTGSIVADFASVSGIVTAGDIETNNINVSGIVTTGTVDTNNLSVSGVAELNSVSVGGTTGISQYVLTSTGNSLIWQSAIALNGVTGINVVEDFTNDLKYLSMQVAAGTTQTTAISSNELVYTSTTKNLGIGTTNPTSKLTVKGDVLISGVVTATTFNGNLSGYASSAGIATYATVAGIATYTPNAGVATYAPNAGIASYTPLAGLSTFAGTATNLYGGYRNYIPYQIETDITGFIPYGNPGYVLTSDGDDSPPYWASLSDSIVTGTITVREEGNIVGSARSISSLNFVGPNITATADVGGNIATITVADYVSISGYSSISGIATYAVNAGVSTYANVAGIATYAVNAGIATYAPNAGVATYAPNAGVSTYANVAGISTYAINAGIATYATVAGIATYATNAGVATYSNVAGIATYTPNAGVATYAPNAGVSTYANVSGIATYAINAGLSTTAVNLQGGSGGSVPYQSSSGITTFLTNGSPGELLQSNGGTNAPSWASPQGLTIGYANTAGISSYAIIAGIATYSTVSGVATYANVAGVATYTPNAGIATYAPNAGIATYANVAGIATYTPNAGLATYASNAGIASYANVAGIATYTPIAGIATYTPNAGIATYATRSGIATYATTAGVSTNLQGGSGGAIPYQFSSGITSFLSNGNPGELLQSNGGTSAPSWSSPQGLTIGYANTAGIATYAINAGIATYATTAGVSTYASSSGIATYANTAGIATYASTAGIATYATRAGIATYAGAAGIATYATTAGLSTTATNLQGGSGGSVPYQSSNGITTFLANGNSGELLQSNGGTNAPSWASPQGLTIGYANTAGIASVAVKLQTARNISLSGDISGSVSFDGSSDVSIAATIQPNSVALGNDTTGNYVQSITGTGNQITVTGGVGEGSTPVLSIPSQFNVPQDATITRDLQVNRNLDVKGNITIGGTTAFINVQQLTVTDPDIVLGYRTDSFGNDVSNDNTANHGGISIASTEGNPLVSLYNPIKGEITPATYKKIMWFNAGSFVGQGTDAWLINYAVGIGSTQFPSGTVLAAGNVQFSKDDLSVVRNINASGVITATKFVGALDSTSALSQSVGFASTATNLAGGSSGSLPYQSSAGITSFLSGTATNNQVLLYDAVTNKPYWGDVSSGSGAFEGITITDENVTSFTGITTIGIFGSNVVASSSGTGIASIRISENLVGTSLSISGISTIGTVNISSGIITSNTITPITFVGNLIGSASTASYATTAYSLNGLVASELRVAYANTSGLSTTAVNLQGGSDGSLPYQSSSGVTTFLTNGIAGQLLQSNGGTNAPSWASPQGLTIGYANNAGIASYSNIAGVATYSTIAGIATYSNSAGIATYATSSGISTYANTSGIATYATTAGLSTTSINLQGGSGGSVPYQSSSGITTFIANGTAGQLLQSNGGTNAPSWTSVSSLTINYANTAGVATYANTAGIATYTTTAGVATYANTSGIATYATTAGVSTVSQGLTGSPSISITNLNVSGISTLGTVRISSGIVSASSGVVTYYGDGSNLTGVVGTQVVTQTSTATPVYPTFANAVGVSSIGIATNQFVFIPSTGNVGVGTTNPLSTFQVGSAITMYGSTGIISARQYFGDGSRLSGVTATAAPGGTTGQVQFNNSGSMGGAAFFNYDSTNLRVGIGTSTPTARLSVSNPTSGNSLLLVNDNLSDGSLFRVSSNTGSLLVDVDSDGTVLFPTSGNVGIGTTLTSPTTKLQVDGDVTARYYYGDGRNLTNISASIIAQSGSSGQILYNNNGISSAAAFFNYDSTNLRVGIGTSTPTARLSVSNPTSGNSLLLVNDNLSDGSLFRVSSNTGSLLVDVDSDGTVLFPTSGNVGIGTTLTTPTSKLHVGGDVTARYYYGDGRNLTNISASIIAQSGSSGQILYNNNGISSAAAFFNYDSTNLRVGIGTSTPTARLSVSNPTSGNSLLLVNDNLSDGSLFRVSSNTGSLLVDVDSDGTVLFPTSGNVGIGTTLTTPTSKLHVDGDVTARDVTARDVTARYYYGDGRNLTNISASIIAQSGSSGQILYNNNGISSAAAFFNYDSTNLRVGIGTSTPTARLSVSNPTSGNSLLLVNDNLSDGSLFRVSSNTGSLLVDVDSDGTVLFPTSGNVGIGTTLTTPTSKLQVNGDARIGINTSQGVILTSANGTKYRLIVSDAGALSTVLVP